MDFNTLMIVTGWIAIAVSIADIAILAMVTRIFLEVLKRATENKKTSNQ